MVEIETESLGKGLIATDLGFSTEAIKDGVNGYKIKLGDIEAFRKCILKLWNEPTRISQIGKNARHDYEQKYKPDDNYEQLMEIYKKMIRSYLWKMGLKGAGHNQLFRCISLWINRLTCDDITDELYNLSFFIGKMKNRKI